VGSSGDGAFIQLTGYGRCQLTRLQTSQVRIGHPRRKTSQQLERAHLAGHEKRRVPGGGHGLPAERRFPGAAVAVQDVQTRLEPAAKFPVEAGNARDRSPRSASGEGVVRCLGVGLSFVKELPASQ
jgi:hypothetical protein